MLRKPLERAIRQVNRLLTGEDQEDGQLLERFVSQRDEAAFATMVQRTAPWC